MADHGLEHRRHRGLAHAGDVGPLHHRVGQQGHQHHQRGDDDEAQDRGTADVGTFLGEARVDAGALDAQEHEHRNEHRRPHLLEHAALEVAAVQVGAEQVELEGEDQQHDEDQDRHHLGHGDDAVDDGGLLSAAQNHEMEQPDPGRGDQDRHHRVAVAEHREERPQGRLDQHPIGDVADAAADPVAEGREEARIVAEARLGVGKDAGIEVGLALSQRLKHAGQHVHAGPSDQPGNDRAHRPGGVGEGPR